MNSFFFLKIMVKKFPGRGRSLSEGHAIRNPAGTIGNLVAAAGALYSAYRNSGRTIHKTGYKRKFTGSRTKTVNKRRKSMKRELPGHIGTLHSSFVHICKNKNRSKKLFKRLTPRQHKINNFSAQLYVPSASNGNQASDDLVSFLPSPVLNTMQTDVANFKSIDVGNTIVPTPRPGDKVFLEGYTATLMFTNNSQLSIEMIIFDCFCKRDGNGNVRSCALKDLVTTSGGIIDIYKSLSGRDTPLDVLGVEPFDSPYLRQYWKCMKQTRVQLAGGQTHKHTIFRTMEHIYDEAVTAQNFYLKGYAHEVFVLIRGYPLDEGQGLAVSTTEMTIDVVGWVNYKFRYLVANRTHMQLSDSQIVMPTTSELFVTQTNQTQVVGKAPAD